MPWGSIIKVYLYKEFTLTFFSWSFKILLIQNTYSLHPSQEFCWTIFLWKHLYVYVVAYGPAYGPPTTAGFEVHTSQQLLEFLRANQQTYILCYRTSNGSYICSEGGGHLKRKSA